VQLVYTLRNAYFTSVEITETTYIIYYILSNLAENSTQLKLISHLFYIYMSRAPPDRYLLYICIHVISK